MLSSSKGFHTNLGQRCSNDEYCCKARSRAKKVAGWLPPLPPLFAQILHNHFKLQSAHTSNLKLKKVRHSKWDRGQSSAAEQSREQLKRKPRILKENKLCAWQMDRAVNHFIEVCVISITQRIGSWNWRKGMRIWSLSLDRTWTWCHQLITSVQSIKEWKTCDNK